MDMKLIDHLIDIDFAIVDKVNAFWTTKFFFTNEFQAKSYLSRSESI